MVQKRLELDLGIAQDIGIGRAVAISIENTKIAENDYNLSVSSYVVPKDNREKINITELNKEVAKTVEKIDQLRADIDAIINEIES